MVQEGQQQPVFALAQSAPQKQTRRLIVVQLLLVLQPQCPEPQLQPSKCSSPTYPMPQSCARPGITTRGDGTQLGLQSRAVNTCSGGTLNPSECTILAYFSTVLLWGKTCTQKEQSLLKHDFRASAPAPGEKSLPLTGWQQTWSREKVSPHALHRLQLLQRMERS